MHTSMNAGEVCIRSVIVAEHNMPLIEAAQLMRDRHVGCLVIVREVEAGRQVMGMLTDRDIVTAVVAKELAPDQLLTSDVMSSNPATAREEDSIVDMLSTMRRGGLRRLPVVSASGILIGLVTLDDLLPLMAEQLREMAAVIEAGHRHEQQVRP